MIMYSPKYGAQDLRRSFKTPEGVYKLQVEKRPGQATSSFDRPFTRITAAEIQDGEDKKSYLIINLGDSLHISLVNNPDKETLKQVYFRREAIPVCHCWAPSSDGADLLVGLSNGEAILLSLRQVLNTSSSQSHVYPLVVYSSQKGESELTCTAVSWTTSENPKQLIAAHSDGTLKLYDKSLPANGIDGKSSGKTVAPTYSTSLCCTSIRDATVSPDGTKLAVVSKDGLLRIFDTATKELINGCQSYYGGLLCCAWSADSKVVATGGEDDMVSVFSVQQGCVVVYGEGHNSWISQVAFDHAQEKGLSGSSPEESIHNSDTPGASFYRVGSVGQDGQVALWDIEIDIDIPQSPADMSLGGRLESSGSADVKGLDDSLGKGPFGNYSHELVNPTDVIAPAPPHKEMEIQPPIAIHKLHSVPATDLMFLKDYMFTCDCNGHLKCWAKPTPHSLSPTQAMTQDSAAKVSSPANGLSDSTPS